MCKSSTFSSSKNWCYQLPWLRSFLFFLVFTIVYMTMVPCSAIQVSYTDHCASIVPESRPSSLAFTTFPLPPIQYGYYSIANNISNLNTSKNSSNLLRSFRFHTQNVYETVVEGVFKVEGTLFLRSSYLYNFVENFTYDGSIFSLVRPRLSKAGSLTLRLQGFWSIFSGELCMVGSSRGPWREGKFLDLSGVLRLNDFKNSSTITSLLRGTLESLITDNDSKNFGTISILMFPTMNYKYTLVSEELSNGCAGEISVPESLSLSLHQTTSICSVLSRFVNAFELEYASDCKSAKSCNPFGESAGYLPRVMSLRRIQCSEDRQKLRFLLEFPSSTYFGNYWPFNPNTTLVGEGSWDERKNGLCVVACRILNTTVSFASANIGDCSIRMSLRFPAIWSIRNTSSIVGQVWSSKPVNDPGYFHRIMFSSYGESKIGVPGLKYEYTELDRIQKSCPKKKPVKKNGEKYPNGYSTDMRFDMSVKNSKGKIAWGYAVPLATGNQLSNWYRYLMPLPSSRLTNSVVEANNSNSGPLNISYKMSFTLVPGVKLGGWISQSNVSSLNTRIEISAQGIYDAETGGLCMVGCRYLDSNNQIWTKDSMDCEILVNLQFSPLNSKNNGGYIKGSIQSTRKKSDSLYIEPLYLSSAAISATQARQSIWRMDLEVILVLISNTLACVFLGFQLLYVKKRREVLPFNSLVMLVVLTLGHLMPLVLNFEALFLQNRSRQTILLESGGWLEVNEVIVRVVTMVAFLLQFRLLQLTWSARKDKKNQNHLLVGEKKVLYVSLPLYGAGGFIALFVNWRKNKFGFVMHSPLLSGKEHTLWRDLRSYAGLILDGFLFPQILLNIFCNSKENALSHSFYIGTTLVRLLPHAYDLYRAQNYVRHINVSYIYANPGADFYSTTWDVIIFSGGLLFAAIIYLQQRFGDRCILSQRFRVLELGSIEKVPAVASTE